MELTMVGKIILGFLGFFAVDIFLMMFFDVEILFGVGRLITDIIEKSKEKKHIAEKPYKDFIHYTNGKKNVVELPFSVIQPLLRDESSIIIDATKSKLVLRGEPGGFYYIKFSKEEYDKYTSFLDQQEVNKQNLKKTEDTLAVTRMINKELKRINDEAMASVVKETEKIKNITEACEHLNLEEPLPKVDALTSKIDTVTTYVLNDGMEWELKTVAVQSEKFDQELFNKIWNGQKVIIIRDEYERGIFNACYFDNVIRYRGTAAPITDPLFARYLCNDNEWIISIATPFLAETGVNIIDLAKRCPDFTAKFKQRIQNEGIRYDRL